MQTRGTDVAKRESPTRSTVPASSRQGRHCNQKEPPYHPPWLGRRRAVFRSGTKPRPASAQFGQCSRPSWLGRRRAVLKSGPKPRPASAQFAQRDSSYQRRSAFASELWNTR